MRSCRTAPTAIPMPRVTRPERATRSGVVRIAIIPIVLVGVLLGACHRPEPADVEIKWSRRGCFNQFGTALRRPGGDAQRLRNGEQSVLYRRHQRCALY